MKSNKINWFQVQGETMRMGGVTAKERFRLGLSLVEKKNRCQGNFHWSRWFPLKIQLTIFVWKLRTNSIQGNSRGQFAAIRYCPMTRLQKRKMLLRNSPSERAIQDPATLKRTHKRGFQKSPVWLYDFFVCIKPWYRAMEFPSGDCVEKCS